MTNINAMLQEICPAGVPFYSVADIFITKNGYTPATAKKEFWTNGSIPWFRMEDIRDNGRILKDSIQKITPEAVKGGRLFPANSIIVATSATIGEHALITVPHLSNQRFTSLSLRPEFAERLDMKFVFYYCFKLDEWCRNNTTTSSFASVDMNGFKKFRFPVPPLEVQQEIVAIVDRFTKLEAELEARQRQFLFYRKELLDLKANNKISSFETMKLGEICLIKTGQPINKIEISENPGPYPVINSGRDPLGFLDRYNTENDPIGITSRGAGVGSVTWREGKYYRGNLNYSATIKNPDLINVRFIYHWLVQNQPAVQALCSYDGIPALNKSNLETLEVLVPSPEEQSRIVAILDRFDELTSSLSTGLPAEIAARRRQYEYYRDQLLTFKEAA